ncbi:MAG: ion channel [Candidatus Omnitrophota bacterium]
MDSDSKLLEKQAHAYLSEGKLEEAYNLFRKVANFYKNNGQNKEAALCFASAASCWSIKSGEKLFYNAALSYEEAALQAEKSFDFEYASLLYKYAAMNYERDGEFFNFADCFYKSKESYRKFLKYMIIHPKKYRHLIKTKEEKGIANWFKHVLLWLGFTFSYLVWGYGERPMRTFFSGLFIIFISAICYSLGHLLKNDIVIQPDFFQSIYFSIITFTTVGYGDIAPLGLSKLVVMIEALSAIIIMPLFLVGLSRRYLRI